MTTETTQTVPPVTIAVTVNVPMALIHNALIGAFEASYWLHQADLIEGQRHSTPNLVWWGEQSVFEQPYKIALTYDDPNDDEGGECVTEITQDDVTKGVTIMATKFPRHFGDLMGENDDSTTHDVFMQCVVLGDVIYG